MIAVYGLEQTFGMPDEPSARALAAWFEVNCRPEIKVTQDSESLGWIVTFYVKMPAPEGLEISND